MLQQHCIRAGDHVRKQTEHRTRDWAVEPMDDERVSKMEVALALGCIAFGLWLCWMAFQ